MKLVLRITEGKDDPEFIWRDLQTITRQFIDAMIERSNSLDRMLVWWANNYQDMTSPDLGLRCDAGPYAKINVNVAKD